MVISLEKLEKEVGFFALNPNKWPQSLTKEDFLKILQDNHAEFQGIAYDDRISFLRSNGYEVNRKNLLDNSLTAKPA